jgi:hypothetical protein
MDTQVLRWRTEHAFTLDVAEFDAATAQADQPEKGTIMRLSGRPWRNARPFIAETFYLRSMMNGSTRTANAFGKNMRMCSSA